MALSILIPGALLLGCGDTPDEESHNIAAILSPDGSQVAFSRNFRYYLNKVSVLDPGGSEDTVYEAKFVYIMDVSTRKVTKLTEVELSSFQFNISWEGDLVAYSLWDVVYVMNTDGSGKRPLFPAMGKRGPYLPFTLSADAKTLFYVETHPEYEMYSIRVDDGIRESFPMNYEELKYRDIFDMLWDSSRDRIFLIARSFANQDPIAWSVNPDGTDLTRSQYGLSEYRRRRLGGMEMYPPFPDLEELTRDITHGEWGVPAPEEFN